MNNLIKVKSKIIENRKFLQSQGFFNNDVCEKKTIKCLSKFFDTLIDVGCNEFEISSLFLKYNSKVDIFSIDLNKEFKKLKVSKNIKFYNFAITDKNIKFAYISTNDNKISSLFNRQDYKKNYSKLKKTKISAISLDNFFGRYIISTLKNKDRIFLKIDCEGSDLNVLKSFENGLTKYNISGYFEYNYESWIQFNNTYLKFYNFLTSLNYKIYRMTEFGFKEIEYYEINNQYYPCLYFFSKLDLGKTFKLKKIKFPRKYSDKSSFLFKF